MYTDSGVDFLLLATLEHGRLDLWIMMPEKQLNYGLYTGTCDLVLLRLRLVDSLVKIGPQYPLHVVQGDKMGRSFG